MSQLPPPPPSTNGRGNGDRRPGDGPGNGPGGRPTKSSGIPKWAIWVFLGLLAGALLIPMLLSKKGGEDITYSQFRTEVQNGNVDAITVNNNTGAISGTLNSGKQFHTHRPDAVARRRPGAAEPEERRRHVQVAAEQLPRRPHPVAAARAPDHRVLRLDAAPRQRRDGQRDADRAIAGKDLLSRQAQHHVRRRRRLRRREAGDPRGRRLLEDARAVPRHRCAHPQGRAARRASRHGQDADREGRRGRGRRAVPVGHGVRLHGDVRRRRRIAGARPLPERAEAGPGDHLRGRDRLDRTQARRRPRRRPRRARADPQPDALRDGRLRGDRGHRDDGGDEPPRHPRSRRFFARAASTGRSSCRSPSSRSASRS